ncbi:MAG: hypothetical protein VKO39_09765 [Cyanobacteriota bacterium]|nr:hypothetical protein [Cyanobacteriota bacterium]
MASINIQQNSKRIQNSYSDIAYQNRRDFFELAGMGHALRQAEKHDAP